MVDEECHREQWSRKEKCGALRQKGGTAHTGRSVKTLPPGMLSRDLKEERTCAVAIAEE